MFKMISGAVLIGTIAIGGATSASAGVVVPPPALGVTGPGSLASGQSGVFTVTGCDTASSSSLSIQATNYNPIDISLFLGVFNDGTIELTALNAGVNSLIVQCFDLSGSTPVRLSETVLNYVVNPVVAGPTELAYGATGSYTVEGCKEPGRRVEVTDFQEGRVPDEYIYVGRFSDGAVSFSSTESGGHTLIFNCFSMATDERLGDPVLVDVTVGARPNVAPTASASASPSSGMAPVTVTFSSAGSSDPDGSIVSYQWNFGDGTTSSDPNPTHVYSGPGTFSVTLTVVDNSEASASAELSIVVSQRPMAPPTPAPTVPTTAAAATTAAPVTAAPRPSTSTPQVLPATGSSSSGILGIAAAALVAAGGSMLAIRRRPAAAKNG